MDGTLILEQYTILIRIISFLKTFKNIKLKLTLLLASPTLLSIVMLMSLHFYYRVIMYLDSVICFIF
jgi:hypothetical protein